jgi:hypothetical protein
MVALHRKCSARLDKSVGVESRTLLGWASGQSGTRQMDGMPALQVQPVCGQPHAVIVLIAFHLVPGDALDGSDTAWFDVDNKKEGYPTSSGCDPWPGSW